MSYRIIENESAQAWLEGRVRYANASETAILTGDSLNWSSPYALNLEKRGLGQAEVSEEDQRKFDWNHKRENEIAHYWLQEMKECYPKLKCFEGRDMGGVELWRFPQRCNAVSTKPEMNDPVPYACTPDFVLVDTWNFEPGELPMDWRSDIDFVVANTIAVVEVKTWSAYAADAWVDGTPKAYRIQIAHQQEVLDCDLAYCVVSIGGLAPDFEEITRHPRAMDAMRAHWEPFWDSIVNDYDLEVDGNYHTSQAILARHSDPDPYTSVALTEEHAEAWEQAKKWGLEKKHATDQWSKCRNIVKAAIGDHEKGVLPDGTVIDMHKQKDGKRIPRERKKKVIDDDAAVAEPIN